MGQPQPHCSLRIRKTDRDGDIAGKDNTNGDDHGNNNHDHDHDNDHDSGSSSGSSNGSGNGNGSGNNRWTYEWNQDELRKSFQPQNSHRSDARTQT
jgi:hypothetical protein